MQDTNGILRDGFRHHGRPEAALDDGWVIMPGYPPARAFVYTHQSAQGIVNLQLDVEIALDDGRVIAESVAGLGKSHDEALAHGFSKFAGDSLHPLLCAFYDYPVDEQIEFEEWEVQAEQWEVFKGSLGVTHLATGGPVARPDFSEIAPANLLAFIDEQIKSRMMGDTATHWARFFYAQQDGKCIGSEVLWDNEICEESQDRLRGLDWPVGQGYTSVRSFTLLRKKGAVKQRGAPENARGIEQALAAMLDFCGQNPRADENTIYRHLVSRGFPPGLADRVVVFGPMCFSSVLLQDAFPKEYWVVAGERKVTPHQLDAEPVFAVGRRYAMEVGGSPAHKDAFMSVAGRCALFRAANQALHAGSKLEDLMFSPPIVGADRLQRVAQGAEPDEEDAAGKKKPWWQLW